MQSKTALPAILLMSLTNPAAADHFFVDVETLYGWCQPYETGGSESIGSLCEGYLIAIADILADGSLIHGSRACFSDQVRLTEVRDVVLEALADAPKTSHGDAHSWAAEAIAKAYPCPAGSN